MNLFTGFGQEVTIGLLESNSGLSRFFYMVWGRRWEGGIYWDRGCQGVRVSGCHHGRFIYPDQAKGLNPIGSYPYICDLVDLVNQWCGGAGGGMGMRMANQSSCLFARLEETRWI